MSGDLEAGFKALGKTWLNEPCHEKTLNQNCGFQTGPAQTKLYKHRRWLEAGNFGFRK